MSFDNDEEVDSIEDLPVFDDSDEELYEPCF